MNTISGRVVSQRRAGGACEYTLEDLWLNDEIAVDLPTSSILNPLVVGMKEPVVMFATLFSGREDAQRQLACFAEGLPLSFPSR